MAQRVEISFDNARANKAPVVFVNGTRFALNSLVHTYATETDKAFDGHHVINMTGYWSQDNPKLSYVSYNVVTGELIIDGVSNFAVEEELEEDQNEFGAKN